MSATIFLFFLRSNFFQPDIFKYVILIQNVIQHLISKRIDLTDKKFARLTAIRFISHKKNRSHWLCMCDCGNEVIVESSHLRNNHTQSCGCIKSEKFAELNKGNTRSRKYTSPKITTAKQVWKISYKDGCSFAKFLELSQLPCHYCGRQPFNIFNKYKSKDGRYISKVSKSWADDADFIYNGLDRVDSNQDHNENNIVPCCYACNIAKHNMTVDEFRAWLELIYNNFIQNKKDLK